VVGPTQLTLPRYEFGPLDAALLDGPHAYPFPELEYYGVYPHLSEGALLVIDDIHIPGVANLFRFIKEDAMFDLLEVATRTAFFVRTGAPTFDPLGDGWENQAYNAKRFPVAHTPQQWIDNALSEARSRMPSWVKDAVPSQIRRRFGNKP
jgi:hypothetical protein